MTDLLTPIDRFRREQQDQTAVDRFARLHDVGFTDPPTDPTVSPRTRAYRDLLPLVGPGPGEQYAFEVDLDACSGCKACVSACHSLNGLGESETWRSVGLLVGADPDPSLDRPTRLPSTAPGSGSAGSSGCSPGGTAGCASGGSSASPAGGSTDVVLASSASGVAPAVTSAARPLLQTVTTACHHCVDPACLKGCPVDAYEKDPVTGIVAHLDDQCIGCRYCTLMCPYEVPVFDHHRGIVRKCDMCRDRLVEGEAPACVQGCPTDAISITVVSRADLEAEARPTSRAPSRLDGDAGFPPGSPVSGAPEPIVLVPTAPDSSITVPTTRYVSSRPLPSSMVAADQFSLQPSHGHTPLAVMLVLTQLSVGAFVVSLLFGDRLATGRSWSAGLALALGLLALAASVLHLGRPLLAWRAVIGVRHSWLSREIVVFGGFAALATADSIATWTDASASWRGGLRVAVAVSGVVGVGCSALIYAATRRPRWRLSRTAPRFALTGAIGGGALLLVVSTAAGLSQGAEELPVTLTTASRPLAVLVLVASVVQLVAELPVLRHRHDRGSDPRREHLHRTARLLAGDLHLTFLLRMAAGTVGGVLVPLVVLAIAASSTPSPGLAAAASALGLALVVVAELTARRLFFLAESAPRMPGMMQ